MKKNFCLTKYLLLLAVLMLSMNAYSQNTPFWIESSWRQTNYPADGYLTGFAQDVKANNETVAQAEERVKTLAAGYLAKNVIATIQTVSDAYSRSVEYGSNESIQKTFETQTRAETDATINGIKTDSYYDAKNNYVYAFSYVNRYEVIGYYKAQINMLIQQIEGYIAAAAQFKEKAENLKAEAEYNKTIPLFAKIEYAQGLLTAIDKNVDDSGLQMQKSVALRNNVVQALADLEQGISIFIRCNAQLFGTATPLLENKLKAQLAENNCSFVADSTQADWLIIIDAKAEEYNNAYNTFYSYVNATISLEKRYNRQQVYHDEIRQKGGSAKDYNDAATKAYNDIASKISEQILTYIK